MLRTKASGQPIELEPNSKPYLLKRIISDGFDTVAVLLLFLAISAIVFSTPLASGYNTHYRNCVKVRESAAEQFGEDARAINESLQNNAYYRDEYFAANLHSYLLKLLSGFLAEAVVLLAVPLLSRSRGTPGKLLTKIMPFCEKKQTRASRLTVLGRFVFIFIIDSAFIYLFAGIYTFLLVPVIRLIEMLLNKKNKTICDALTGIMIIEQISYDGVDKFQEEQL